MIEVNSNGDSNLATAQLQEAGSAEPLLPIHPVVRSIEVHEWRQPPLLMTSIGEQEKDEEHDEMSDALRMNQNASNLTHKFMTIQVASETEENDKQTQLDVGGSSVEPAATSNRNKTKMSTRNTVTDRNQNSRGQPLGEST